VGDIAAQCNPNGNETAKGVGWTLPPTKPGRS
jgi:hypothetical protein